MPRGVRQRTAYTGDRTRLSRLEEAIGRDARLSDQTREGAVGQVRQLIETLLRLDEQIGVAAKHARGSKAARHAA
jgi:hypothetical protein